MSAGRVCEQSTNSGEDLKVTGIPTTTVRTLARSIFREASTYGFEQIDFIRLMNELMDLCTAADGDARSSDREIISAGSFQTGELKSLPLVGNRVSIRPYKSPEDAELLKQWLPDRYGRFFVLSSVTAQSVTIDALTNGPGNHLGIVVLPDGRPIGAMAMLDHNRDQRRAELRKLIGDPEFRGRGYAEEATRLWIHYGIHGLGLEKIYVSTLQTQIANIKLNEAIGFKTEGLLRNEVLIDGKRHDVLRMGLCADDNLEQRSDTEMSH